MPGHPYADLPPEAYWRSAVAEKGGAPDAAWCRPKWRIGREDAIATAGSCFAQHLGRRLKGEGFAVMDAEPAPALLPAARHMAHGYGLYSARYGNVYTARQMLQLAEEALGKRPMSTEIWGRDGRFVDALRPTIDPEGHDTRQAVLDHRAHHLKRVRRVLRRADIVVFTLGLTETWENVETGRVYPVCPGTVAGTFDPDRHRFRNLTFAEILDDMTALRRLLRARSRTGGPRMLLTVSPVPLTATASGGHVLPATVYSKSVLRAVAGEMAARFDDVDYFPSYEIVTSPWSGVPRYEANLRSVAAGAVSTVMGIFLEAHGAAKAAAAAPAPAAAPPAPAAGPPAPAEADPPAEMAEDPAMLVKCDEELLDAFGPDAAR